MNAISVERKREEEKNLLACMIDIYCRKNKHEGKQKGALCPQCQALLSYANQRIDKCPFLDTKSFCSSCTVHCYQADRREQIRRVMKYAGPVMLWIHPVPAVKHMINTVTAIMKKRKETRTK